MVLKKTGATILLVLFCCILYAKEGYKIVLQTNEPYHKSCARLALSSWNGNVDIDSSFADRKGHIIFKGEHNLVPGEYIIKWNGKNIELFISEEKYTNEKLILDGDEIIHKKGNAENSHFTRFQNLISYGWKGLPDAAALQKKIDSTATIAGRALLGSLFDLMLNGQIYNRYLKDKRVSNTRFGKKYLTDHLQEIEYNSNDSLIVKADNLIASASDSIKPLVALEIFKYFSKPKIMGQESIACHVAEKYFLNSVLNSNQPDLFEMSTFVMLNKNSLLGMPAQELVMKDTAGRMVSLYDLIKQGEYTILYFYTDDCIMCRLETPQLVDFANNWKKSGLNVYAVYTQDYGTRWREYIDANFNISNPLVNWINVWDPEIESGFHMVYNVISTPQIYLVNRLGEIIGRGLDVKALKELVAAFEIEKKNLILFLNAYFSQYKNSRSDEINRGIDLLYEKSKDDIKIFKDIFSELYYFLNSSEDRDFKESSTYLAKKYIIEMAQLWQSPIFVNIVVENLKKEL